MRVSPDQLDQMLHPAIDGDVDEVVRIQGHDIRFATVDLAKPTSEILVRLKGLPLRFPSFPDSAG